MTRMFISTKEFDKLWDNLGLTDEDLRELEKYILKNPNVGNIIEGTGGAVKIRFALPNRGKSGGIRVIFVDILRKERIHLLLCYPKGKQDNLTDAQKKLIKSLIKSLKGE